MNSNKEPLVTVITVVRNAESLLERTILSIINQTYQNIEYIIIDGASNDGTIDIIKKYEDKISLCISEPDNGIYDAMNKGIYLANGTWINFMNAGDRFFKDSVIESIFKTDNYDQYDLIYGDGEYINSIGMQIHKKTKNLSGMWRYQPFNHQDLFMKTNVIKKYYFDTNNNLAADHELIYKCYNDKLNFLKLNIIIASYLFGGESERRDVEALTSRWQSIRKITPSLKIDLYYFYFINKQKIRNLIVRGLIKKYLPKPIVDAIIRLIHCHNTIPK